MADESINVHAIIYVAEGKEDRVREIMLAYANAVKEHEPGCLKYEVQEGPNLETKAPEFITSETFENQAAYDAHMTTEHYAKLVKSATEEGLLSKMYEIKAVKVVGGFKSR